MTEAAIPLWQVGAPSEAATAVKPATDFQLTQAASRGEMAAFEELYSRHSRRVYSLCLRMTANTAEAEDLAQEVFIQLYRKAGSFRG
ncbi:MAG TPA: sigma factor, partial [Pyrinomonadaceae bacterium]